MAQPRLQPAYTPADRRLRSLSRADWLAVVERAGKGMLAHNMPLLAQALAYSSFLAIPSTLLLAVGLFTLLAGPQTIDSLIARLHGVMPGQATQLLSESLHRLDRQSGTSLAIVLVGALLALWSTTSTMTSYMTALDIAYGRTDGRSFVRKRLTALLMVVCIGAAFLLVAVLLILGPTIEKHLRSSLGLGSLVTWVWWVGQWPVLVVGLLVAFATLLYLAPDVEQPSWRLLAPGSVVAVAIWLAASGAFAFYTSRFGSYNKVWGSFAAVIVMLTWLWITALALLFGAELDAELERVLEHGD